MSIAEKLTAAGYDIAEIVAAKSDQSTRAVEIVAVETDDGPIFGLSYRCDFRAEEEWGVSDLSRAFASRADKSASSHRIWKADTEAGTLEDSGFRARTSGARPGHQMDLVTVTDEAVVLRTSEIEGPADQDWSSASWEKRVIAESIQMIRDHRGYVQGIPSVWRLERRTYAELKARAIEIGVAKPARSKAKVIDQILDLETPEFPYAEPANFHDGHHLVIPRRGGVGVVADALVEAARDGHLLAGGSLGNPFGSGFLLLDERDISRADRDEAEKDAAWHRKQMVAVGPVEEHLRNTGTSVYFIGRPTQDEDGPVRYSVNLSHRPHGQFWGSFTVAEMLADGFAEREAEKYAERHR